MTDGGSEGRASRRSESRPATSRLLGVGARGAERIASATGADRVLEDAMEEAIVRALRSPAVERAIERLVQRNAVQAALEKAIASDEVGEALIRALEGELADRVWREILASNQAQMLVERIAEAPEVRAAIAQQGVGLLTDVGRRLTVVTEALDDAAERLVHGMLGRPGHEAETVQVGLVTRALAAAVDLGLLSAAYSSLMHTPVRLTTDQVLENLTGVGAPPWTWPRDEQVIDVMHKTWTALLPDSSRTPSSHRYPQAQRVAAFVGVGSKGFA